MPKRRGSGIIPEHVPLPPNQSVVLDREPDQEKSLDPSGPRIRCPLCGSSPRKPERESASDRIETRNRKSADSQK